jgi:hypothetical protein
MSCAAHGRTQPDSYIAGGAALNREGPRFSGDIDIFQDSEQRLESAAEADAKALANAGLKLSWKKIVSGKARSGGPGYGRQNAARMGPRQRLSLFSHAAG